MRALLPRLRLGTLLPRLGLGRALLPGLRLPCLRLGGRHGRAIEAGGSEVLGRLLPGTRLRPGPSLRPWPGGWLGVLLPRLGLDGWHDAAVVAGLAPGARLRPGPSRRPGTHGRLAVVLLPRLRLDGWHDAAVVADLAPGPCLGPGLAAGWASCSQAWGSTAGMTPLLSPTWRRGRACGTDDRGRGPLGHPRTPYMRLEDEDGVITLHPIPTDVTRAEALMWKRNPRRGRPYCVVPERRC